MLVMAQRNMADVILGANVRLSHFPMSVSHYIYNLSGVVARLHGLVVVRFRETPSQAFSEPLAPVRWFEIA
jgi:hypothetical protein